MATQQTPARPWFRLGVARQPAPQVPAVEPAPPQPRPPVARPTFRPVAQPQPPQTEPIPPPPAAAPQPSAPRAPASPAVPTAPTPTVPRSPAPRALAPSSSLPASPAPAISTVVLPVTTTSSVPSSPKPRVSAPSSSAPSSPPSKPATTTSSVPSSPATRAAKDSPSPRTSTPTTVTARVPSPAQPSPTTLKPAIETPPQSPKPKPTAPPPSPLTPPPSQIKPNAEPDSKSPPEVVQKNVLMQKTIEKANGDTSKPSIGHTAKEADTKGKAHRKKFSSSDSEEGGMRIITIAGENKGAFMEVIKSPKKDGFEGTSSLYKKGNPGDTSSDSSSEFQKDKKNRGMSMNSTPMSAFMNSNVQGVNNSIVFKSSSTHNDPGVHLALSRKPSNGGFDVKGHSNGYDS